MILKAVTTFLPEFPKLHLGDGQNKASSLILWRTKVEQGIRPTGPLLIKWWAWCVKEAEKTYREYVITPIHQREALLPTAKMPVEWGQLESWMMPKLLEACPSSIKEWISMRLRQGYVDDSHIVLYAIWKHAAPGGADEKVALQGVILNPHTCSDAKKAQQELLRWKEAIRRSAELGCGAPDILLVYRAMESIFL